jgi:hypothetical protein
VFYDMDLVDKDVDAHVIKKTKKCYLIFLEKTKIIFSCTYYIDTYSCQFSSENTTICGLHEKDKLEIFISLNITNPIISVVCIFCHFYVSHIQCIFLENWHK